MATELTWLGHGSWLIATGEHQILLDPFLSDSPVAPVSADRVEADFVLISHGHFDHIADAVAIALRTEARVIANVEICEWLGRQGVINTHAMNLGGISRQPFGTVKMTLAHHSSMLPDGSYGGNPCGFLLGLPEGNVYFACDTALFYDMKLIGEAGVRLAVLPIGDNFTMGPDDAIRAVQLIEPKRVVPVHVNTWPEISQDEHAWVHRVLHETAAEPSLIQPGDRLVL
ncbi:MAG TPA: metal-dependent hydrolase [Planctomycetaceae bacterium]|nr:metal-dependent hydrolase [Planctomycetaceae bacterium]